MIKKCIIIIGIVAFIAFPGLSFAIDESQIEQIEKKLVQKETDLLDPELRLDKLIVERSKLDGVGGWFQGSKKKEIERQMKACESQIESIYSEMKSLQKEVQNAVFAVGYQFEKNGQYKKAIEYYLKIENQDEKIIFRIATCYKGLKDFETAIQWFLKLSHSDQNLLEVVDCYRLDNRMKEAIYWLFSILEPYNDNSAEITALTIIEEISYPKKKTDYPDFNQRLSDVYIAKAVIFYQKNISQAREDYRKAIVLLANGADLKGTSFGVLARYQNNYKMAMDILEQQRDAAERYYENMLREAKEDFDRKERRYRQAQREAEDEYSRRLEQSRRELDRAEWELTRLQNEASPSATLIAQAQQNVQFKRNEYHRVVNYHNEIVEDYVRPYRREMEKAMNEYRSITNRRAEIIENYIAPYKRKVADAQRAFELIRTLHESVFGLR